MMSVVLAAAVGLAAPADAEYRAALDLLYDGSTDTAIARIDALAASAPDDPVGAYLGALALLRKIEQRLDSGALDPDLRRRVERARALSEARLARDPREARARFARAGALGVASRFAFIRGRRKESAREGARMRADLLVLLELEPANKDVLFGLGLYDYYVDVLPRILKLLRFIAGLPGGDRERGKALLEEAKQGSLFHEVEVRDQLYEIYAYYENEPDRALEEIRFLRRRYPGAPLWALELAEHERDRMGLYAAGAGVAREILEQCRTGHPNYAPVVEAMARLSLGQSLLLDLRLPEAREALAMVSEHVPEAAWVPARARLLLGRALELQGDRAGALAHYRAAAASPDRELGRRARVALVDPLPEGQVRAAALLAEARRLREAGRVAESARACREALAAWPRSHEAMLRVAEDDLAGGRAAAARQGLERLDSIRELDPPWVRPWSRLLLARLHDLSGRRDEAVLEYKLVLKHPYGQEDLRELAARGLGQPYAPEAARPEAAPQPKHSR